MQNGTRQELMFELKDLIAKCKNKNEIESAIRDYWRHPDNVAARKPLIGDKESYDNFITRLSDFAIRSDWALTRLEIIAKKKILVAKQLTHVLAARLQNGELTPEQIKILLNALTGNYAEGRRGRLTSNRAFHMNLQLAQAVFAVRVGTDGAYSFISDRVNAGWPLLRLAKLVRHKTTEMIAQNYYRDDLADLADALRKLDNAILSQPKAMPS